MTKEGEISEILKSMKNESQDIEALSVVSLDGLPVASYLPDGADEDRVAALSATIMSLGERAADELKKGSLKQTFIKGKNGYVIVQSIKNIAALMIVTNKNAKLGIILLALRKGVEKIGKVI